MQHRLQVLLNKLRTFGKNTTKLESEKEGEEYRYEPENLAPRILTPKDSAYNSVVTLEDVMTRPECKNVAVTGGFGAGKTSVINTYLNEVGIKRNKVLRVSLSRLNDAADGIKDDEKYEEMIENQVFKQILYKSNALKTSQSRTRRILNLPFRYSLIVSCGVLALFVSILLLCNHIHIAIPDSVLRTYRDNVCDCAHLWIRGILDVIAWIYVAVVFTIVLALLLRCRVHFHIAGLKTDKLEVSLKESGSFLTRNLDEILYFLRAGGYDIVIWEDLDRIVKPEKLFLKLREINMLLNEAESTFDANKPIRFLYAIKDDVFTDEVRTKFFDFIVPVIPIVDKYNAGDYLLEHYRKLLSDIDSLDISVLGMYIRGKRELTNIINEYNTYNLSLIGSKNLRFFCNLVGKDIIEY